MKYILSMVAAGIILALAGCWTITVKHQVEPIYITMNVNVKVEKQLNDFFDFEDEAQGSSSTTNSTAKDKTSK